MKEKLKKLIENVKLRQTRAILIAIFLVVVVMATGASVYHLVINKETKNVLASESFNNSGGDENSILATVGEEDLSIIGNTKSNSSWPGEIISLNNLQIQPEREGTISQWYVRIGEQVRAGQVLGTLSRSPQTLEIAMTLSEKYGELLESRTDMNAQRSYTTKRISQLEKLRKDTENSNEEKLNLLVLKTPVNNKDLLSAVAAEKENARVILYESLIKTFAIAYSQADIPTSPNLILNIPLKPTIGIQDLNSRAVFPMIVYDVLSELDDKNKVPEKSAITYFDYAIKLANASTPDGTLLTVANISKFKMDLITNQQYFVEVLGKIKVMELEIADIRRTSIDTSAEIDSMLAEYKKDLEMAEGKKTAQEKTYDAIKAASLEGSSIIAPKNGIISSIMKRPGEFVGPGMPVAVITAEGSDDIFVRMRIPSNIQKPKVGEILSVIRPGFGTDVKKARLVGIGSSLDNGSYMADVVFTEDTKWPIGASVRVLAPVDSSEVIIRYSSIFWKDDGVPAVWQVSVAGRIFEKKLTIGRTLGSSIEVYTGLKNGDRYITDPMLDIKEGMSIDDFIETTNTDNGSSPAKSGKDESMGGMEM